MPISWWWLAILFFGALAAFNALASELPRQNVVALALVLGCVGAGATWLTRQFGFPGSSVLLLNTTEHPQLALACSGLGWTALVLNSRLAAQRLVQGWRHSSGYGWVLLGLSSILATCLDLLLAPFALAMNAAPVLASGSPLAGLGTFLFCVLSLGLITPWLVKRRGAAPLSHPLLSSVIPLASLALATAHGWHGRWNLATLGFGLALLCAAVPGQGR